MYAAGALFCFCLFIVLGQSSSFLIFFIFAEASAYAAGAFGFFFFVGLEIMLFVGKFVNKLKTTPKLTELDFTMPATIVTFCLSQSSQSQFGQIVQGGMRTSEDSKKQKRKDRYDEILNERQKQRLRLSVRAQDRP